MLENQKLVAWLEDAVRHIIWRTTRMGLRLWRKVGMGNCLRHITTWDAAVRWSLHRTFKLMRCMMFWRPMDTSRRMTIELRRV